DAYWRDVGTLDAYYEANMDLVAVDPLLNMYDQRWPIRTFLPSTPPPKFVFAERGPGARCGQALDSIVCLGSIVSGGTVERSVLGRKPESRRYRELLPVRRRENIVTLGESMTPLVHCPRLQAGKGELLVKDEGRLPTGSFKARGVCVAVSMAKELGVKKVAIP